VQLAKFFDLCGLIALVIGACLWAACLAYKAGLIETLPALF